MTSGFKETTYTYDIELEVECEACGGTGLYVGMAERNGAAVVCARCKGTGRLIHRSTMKKFHGRRRRENVERVYHTAGGYTISAHDVTTKEGKEVRFSAAGCSYEEWLVGAVPKPIEDLHCPYEYTAQEMQLSDHKAHVLYEERCREALPLGGFLSSCKLHGKKGACWRRYHELVDGSVDG